ncbi:MAG: hypothetical protein KQJ78_18760 [Deltaproteobacteria bacterium]|nr:hypothetical protein [Deltaproteobacteria bacterium]
MNSRRLARLMGIICEIKANPRRSPDELCRRFDISRRQFYKDRDTLAELGFKFHYSRTGEGFVLDKELTFNVSGLSLADLFALVLAVRELTRLSDFGLAMGALAGLRRMMAGLPPPLGPEFAEALDQLVVADGMGCPPEVLRALEEAVEGGRRVVLVLEGAKTELRYTVDPRQLLLREGSLYLEAEGLGGPGSGLLALHRVKKVIPTPFFSPPAG